MRFQFVTSAKIIVGNGVIAECGGLAADLGSKVLLVTGGGSVSPDRLLQSLEAKGLQYQRFQVKGEPHVSTMQAGIQAAEKSGCDMVIAMGGGSVLDTGKVIAAMLTNPGDLMDHIETIGKGQPTTNPSVPMIAIPTTSGTGSEVTKNSVIYSPEHKIKVSMRSDHMIPRIALLDPELTHSMPPAVTASSGMDALTQLIEGYTSTAANPMTDALAREGILRAARSLRVVYTEPENAPAREDMAIASLFSGIVLTNGGLAAVHGFSGVVGGLFNAPHGALCGSLLPASMRVNIESCRQDESYAPYLQRFTEIARILTNDLNADPMHAADWVAETARLLHIPRLSSFGITPADFPLIIERSRKKSHMRMNPVYMTDELMERVLELSM